MAPPAKSEIKALQSAKPTNKQHVIPPSSPPDVSFISAIPLHRHRASITPLRIRLTPIHRQRYKPKMALTPAAFARGLLCPAAFVGMLILHARNPARLPTLLPALWPMGMFSSQRRRALPVSLLASFRLGRIVQRMDSPSGTPDQEVLTEARDLVTGDIDMGELKDLEAYLEDLENRQTFFSRLRGALSLVNVIWLVSIVGLFVTFWPTLQFLGGRFVRVVSQWFITHVVPVLIKLHKNGVFEAVCYMACSLIVAQGARYITTMGTGAPGSYIAVTAFAGAMLCFRYTMHLHFDKYLLGCWSEETAETRMKIGSLLWGGMQFGVLAPLAVAHESELLGFGSVWGLLSMLGYIVGTIPMGYVVGFSSENAMDRTAVSCALLVTGFVLRRIFGWGEMLSLKPFQLGVMVMGNIGYFLALLIRSSRYYAEGRRFIIVQVHMVVSLLLALGVGRVFGIEAMNNTATTFGVLYLAEKIGDLCLPWGSWGIVAWYGAFGLLNAIAGFSRTHPKYLQSLFDGRGFLSRDYDAL